MLQAQVDLLLRSFRYDYAFGIGVLFSIHLIIVGALIVRSRYMPWWLGALLVVDGAGWIVTNVFPYFYSNASFGVIGITALGELVFMLWLLIKGWTLPDTTHPAGR